MLETKRVCLEQLSIAFAEMLLGEISSAAAKQILADVVFLEIALAQDDGAFEAVREKLLEKAQDTTGFLDRLTGHLKVYWNRTSLLFGILVVEEP